MNQPSNEVYTPGYSANASNFMANRRAATHAAFLLPSLRSGLRVLDCGCGPGSITLGLAEAVQPGHVTGIDIADSQIALAKANAAAQHIDNVDFQTGSIYELAFEDGTFDVVFAHAVFEHLANPVKAMREISRVLKTGGVLGICSPDWGGFIVAPENPALNAAITFYKQVQMQNGGDPYAGRKLATFAQEADFVQNHLSAYYECYQQPALIADYLALRIEGTTDAASLAHLPAEFTLEALANALRTWSQQPACMFAQAWVTLVAHKL
jgi:ubiquinone/menaquinone biosynthesis C-methylase UbiE